MPFTLIGDPEMIRTFAEHTLRPVTSADGLWAFVPVDTPEGIDKIPQKFPRRIEVPSAWESVPDLQGYRGCAWYQRQFEVSGRGHTRIVFGGVSHTGTVYVDGKRVGRHYDAFTPWEVIVPNLAAGTHTLSVRVDNRFGPESALHIPNDYYTYGGITRPVEIQEVPDLFLEALLAKPVRKGKDWQLQVRVRLHQVGQEAGEGLVRLEICGKVKTVVVPRTAQGQTAEVTASFTLSGVTAWSAETPALYTLRATLLQGDVAVDDLCDRVGFREIRVKGKKLLLNGEPLRLWGFNRHEDHPMYGCALPPVAMAQDLAIFEDLQANFLRTSHYPNDQRLLDMCDERGIYVWEESHARQTPFKVPNFDEQIRVNTQEMVEKHYNHPCILMWGCLNECDTASEDGEAVHARVLQQLRSLDDSRPITYAGHLRQKDRCCGYADIVSWNLYTGWYGGEPEKTLEDFAQLLDWLDSEASRGGEGKPVIISEFGAGAIPGVRNHRADPWSEEFQCVVIDEALKVYLTHPRIVGAAIWQFCDVRVTREGNPRTYNAFSPMGRPRCMNNKGIVDEYRRPKLAYDTVRRHFAAAAAAARETGED